MAVKKSELYSSLWKSCDELRGGMDASQYKDYVLVILFMKYVSDKFQAGQTLLEVPKGGSFSDLLALKNDPEIGDKTNKIIAKLASANDLQGVIDLADFNDPEKLGRGKDMVDRLTRLYSIFDRPELDFGSNAAEGDDLLGDAYEYLMRHFATEAGKSKGQFYTPSEVSRIMSKVIGLGSASSSDQTIYDPTCGSGSLLLKAHAEAKTETGLDLAVYGQEMDNATAALSKMNMILHGVEGAEIWQDNTLSTPHFKDPNGGLQTFDYVVANPPFSTKSWTSGIDVANDPYGRFTYGTPPPKNGDYAFLLHMLTSLKADGKAAVILPHGVLFRGNAEANIRRELIKRGFIKGIIGLPTNLFYGTGIPAALVLLDKEGAAARTSIFIIDASKGFIKDGNKNRLRERDIHRIVDTYTRMENIDGFSRLVPLSEIANERNDYDLNIPRYIDSTEPVDVQDLEGHLFGGIPESDIDRFQSVWEVMPGLRAQLFEELRPGYVRLQQTQSQVAETVTQSSEFVTFSKRVMDVYDSWAEASSKKLKALEVGHKPKELVAELGESLLTVFADVPLIDSYGVYQDLMTYWSNVMHDDVFAICSVGWEEAARPVPLSDPKDDVDYTVGKVKYRSQLVPREVLIAAFFSDLQSQFLAAVASAAIATAKINELTEEYGGDEGALSDLVTDAGKLPEKAVAGRLKLARKEIDGNEEVTALESLVEAFDALTAAKKLSKAAGVALNSALSDKYAMLDRGGITQLTVEGKWLSFLHGQIEARVAGVESTLGSRLSDLGCRYAITLEEIQTQVDSLSLAASQLLTALSRG